VRPKGVIPLTAGIQHKNNFVRGQNLENMDGFADRFAGFPPLRE
jgi:hypothetical protein